MPGSNTLPLAGRRIVVTRAAEQAGELVRALEELGASVLLLPTVTFADAADPGPLDRAIAALGEFHWLLFTSQNAIHFFLKRCRLAGGGGTHALAPPLCIAAIGPATAEAAEKEGLRVHYVAKQFRGEALARELGQQLAGKRVLLPRSDRARPDLPAALRAQGAEIVDVVAYHTGVPEKYERGVADAVRDGAVDVVTFLSPSAFHHLVEELGEESLRRFASRMTLAAIGPVTSAAIRAAGLRVGIEAAQATSAALVAAVCQYFIQRQPSGVNSP